MVSRKDRTLDEYLILQSQAGDDVALGMLIERWQPDFLRFATVVTRNPDLAADVVQDAWIKIIRTLDGLRDPIAWEAWSHRIVSRLCIDRLRTNGRFTPLVDDIRVNPAVNLESENTVMVVLSQLDDRHRVVLALHYLQGFEVAEIARILTIPQGTVKSRLHKARHTFKDTLEQQGAGHRRTGHENQKDAAGLLGEFAFSR